MPLQMLWSPKGTATDRALNMTGGRVSIAGLIGALSPIGRMGIVHRDLQTGIVGLREHADGSISRLCASPDVDNSCQISK